MNAQALAAPSEVSCLFSEWLGTRAAFELREDDTDQSEFDRMVEIERAMFALPSKSPADLAMKLFAFTSGEVLFVCPLSQPLADEISALVGKPLE